MSHRTNIIILFRKKTSFAFSVEEVFNLLVPRIQELLKDSFMLDKVQLPYIGDGFINKLRNILFLYRHRKKLIHITGEVYYASLFHAPNILTIHDIALALNGNWLKRNLIGLFWYKIPAKKARYITVVSQASKKEFVDYTKVDESKVVVIPNPLNPSLSSEPLPSNSIKKVLMIGTKPNKNLHRMIEALENLPITLHIIGKLPKSTAKLLENKHINFTNDFDIPYQKVINHYIQTDVVCFASTYEGFGLPIIEAQAIGRPVITSNLSSMPEIAGAGALLVDPYNVEDIRKALLKLLHEEDLANKLIENGRKNVKRFTVDTIAEQYASVYMKALLDE